MGNVTILGASGMLGSACKAALPKADCPTRHEFDALLDEPNFSDWVINCIGAIPQKVSDLDVMWKLNADFPQKIVGAKVIQITTDCVYSGFHGNYSEISPPDPNDDYGKSKLAGEKANSMKIRCSIVGPDVSDASLFEWVRQQPLGATINGYSDHYWNGVSTQVFANLAKGIIEANAWEKGLWHLVPKDFVSKFDLVRMIAKKTNRDDLKVTKFETGSKVDRRLVTIYPKQNEKFWEFAGYEKIPTIEQIIADISL